MKHLLLAFVALFSTALFASDPPKADQIRIRAFIDKEDIVHVQGDKVWFTHVIGAFPGQWGVDWPTYVNEVPWKPNWDNAPKSDAFRMDNPLNFLPMEKLVADRISICLLDNTNSVASVIEYPDEYNGWTLSIRMDNTRIPRALWMDIEISWREQIHPKMKRFETIETHGVPAPPVIVPPTVPSPTPVGRR